MHSLYNFINFLLYKLHAMHAVCPDFPHLSKLPLKRKLINASIKIQIPQSISNIIKLDNNLIICYDSKCE